MFGIRRLVDGKYVEVFEKRDGKGVGGYGGLGQYLSCGVATLHKERADRNSGGFWSYSVKKSVYLQARIKSRFLGFWECPKDPKKHQNGRFFTKKSVEDLGKKLKNEKPRKIKGLRDFCVRRSTDFLERNVAKTGEME